MAQKKFDAEETELKKEMCGFPQEKDNSLLGDLAALLWDDPKITNVTIKLQNSYHRAHTAVLSCYSQYFRDILKKSFHSDNIIEINAPTVTSEAFDILLLFMYTGELKVTCQNIGDVYIAARKFHMKEVELHCTNILTGKTNEIVHYLYFFVTARKEGLLEDSKKAMRKMASYFEQIVASKEFLDLEYEDICALLSADELAVRSEVVVYQSALKWIREKSPQREKYAAKVIGCVRFPLMTLNEVLRCYTPPLLPAITEIPEVQQKLLEATCYIAAKTVNEEKRFAKFSCKPRVYLPEKEPIVLWDPNIFVPDRHHQYKKQSQVESNAATKIQAHFRGFSARKRVESLRSSLTSEGDSVSSRSSYLPSPGSTLSATLCVKITDLPAAPSKEDERKKQETEPTSDGRTHPVEHAIQYDSKALKHSENLDQKKPHGVYPMGSFESSRPVTTDDLESLSSSIRRNALNSKLQDPPSYRRKRLCTMDVSKAVKKAGALHIKTEAELKDDCSYPGSCELSRKPVLHKISTEPMSKEMEMYDSPSSSSTNNSGITQSEDHTDVVVENIIRTETIITMGGFHPTHLENDQLGRAIHNYVPVTDEWSKIGDMRQCYHHHCILYYNDSIYCIGGCDPQVTKQGVMIPLSSCSKYKLETNLWYNVSSMFHSRMYHGAVVLNDKIYSVGGKNENDSILDSMESYNPSTDKWELLETSLSCPKMGFGFCAYRNELWLVGGMSQDVSGRLRLLEEVECYDPVQKTWKKIFSKLPSPRCFCTLVVCSQKIYILGGTTYRGSRRNETVESIPDVDCYDDKRDEWIPRTPLPNPRHCVSAASIGGVIFIMGGLTTYHKVALDEVMVYDDDMESRFSLSPIPTFVCGFAATTVPRAVQASKEAN